MRLVKIGYITGSFGVDGGFKIKPLTEHPEIIGNAEFLLTSADGKTVAKSLKVKSITPRGDSFIAKSDNIATKEIADTLRNLSILVPEEELPNESNDEVYWFKIEGADVFDTDNHKLGILVDYIETGAHDVFRIKMDGGGYALISNNKTHVLSIDVRERKIVIEPEGLVREDV